jgi:hypothetical protein
MHGIFKREAAMAQLQPLLYVRLQGQSLRRGNRVERWPSLGVTAGAAEEQRRKGTMAAV